MSFESGFFRKRAERPAEASELSAGEREKSREEALGEIKYLLSPGMGREDVYVHINELVELRDDWVRKGVITSAEVSSLPEVKKAARDSLRLLLDEGIHKAGFDLERFVAEREQWVNAGFITMEEANQIAHERAVEELGDEARGVNTHSETLKELKAAWVNAGAITSEEADQLIAKGRANTDENEQSA